MSKLIAFVGESGSGKSTAAKSMVETLGYVRLNRDSLRIDLKDRFAPPEKGNADRAFENYVAKIQREGAISALRTGQTVIIDDTNLNENTLNKWRVLAEELKVEFEVQRMTTSRQTCIERDSKRLGKARVGRAVIDRQFLESGRLDTLLAVKHTGQKIVIVDLDGTVADMRGVRGPFDEHKVHLDKVYPVIVKWVQELALEHLVLIVSGRHSTCGDASADWLIGNDVPFANIFMRHAWDSRSDTIVKQEILNAILNYIPKEQILCVIDDRPAVCAMWKENGLSCYPVRGTTDHTKNCPYYGTKAKHSCDHCGALGWF